MLVITKHNETEAPAPGIDEMIRNFFKGIAYICLDKGKKDDIVLVYDILTEDGFVFEKWPWRDTKTSPLAYLLADGSGPYHCFEPLDQTLNGIGKPALFGSIKSDMVYSYSAREFIDAYKEKKLMSAMTDSEYLSVLIGEEEHV